MASEFLSASNDLFIVKEHHAFGIAAHTRDASVALGSSSGAMVRTAYRVGAPVTCRRHSRPELVDNYLGLGLGLERGDCILHGRIDVGVVEIGQRAVILQGCHEVGISPGDGEHHTFGM